jgi:hypothetical protein
MRAESAAKESLRNKRDSPKNQSHLIDLVHESAFCRLIETTGALAGTMRPFAALSRWKEMTPRMLI